MMSHQKALRSALVALFLLAPQAAQADGCLLAPAERDVWEGSQKAVVKHKNGREDLVLMIQLYASNDDYYGYEVPQNMAWVVPLPAEPTVSEVSSDLLYELSELTRPLERTAYEEYCGDVAMSADPTGGVDYLYGGQIGMVSFQVIRATDPSALYDYLDERGLAHGQAFEDALVHYIDKGWLHFFTAHLKAEDEYDSGIQPIVLTFDTKEPVYPMRITAAMGKETDLVLYTIADHRMTFPGAQLKYARAHDPDEMTKALQDFTASYGPFFLTRLERHYGPADMEDIVLVGAPDDESYREIIARGGAKEPVNLASSGLLMGLLGLGALMLLRPRGSRRGR